MKFSKIIWHNNTPKSQYFGDFYFSTDSAVDESSYNFLKHNFLDDRFKKLISGDSFYICETGFGSGLNFLLTMELWNQYAPNNANLEYISFEKYPMNKLDLERVLRNIDKIKNYQSLVELYAPVEGISTYKFNNITLKLIVDDVNNIGCYSLPKLDAWFLDGFAPAKNSSMWCDNLFKNMAVLAKNNTSYATFTASSMVRKALLSYGFEVKKDKGFGKKREMMYGSFRFY